MSLASHEHLFQLFADPIRAHGVKRICDFGAGCGWLGKRLLEADLGLEKVWALDLYEDPAKVPEEGMHPGQEFLDVRKAEPAELRKQGCEAVLLLNSLHHLEFPIRSLQQVADMVPVGGHVFILDFESGWDSPANRSAFVESCLGGAAASLRGFYHRSWFSLEQAKDLVSFGPFEVQAARSLKLSHAPEEREGYCRERLAALRAHDEKLRESQSLDPMVRELTSKLNALIFEHMEQFDHVLERMFFLHLTRRKES